LDEASFQQLLSAAYVLQEHNDRLRGKEVHADFAKNLSAIVETQKLIQTLQLDLEAAAKLVAERVQKITQASGTAIGILEKGELVYRAGTGIASVDTGTRVAPASSMSADCLSRGNAVNYTDASANSPTRAGLFLEREVKSFIAVPVYHAGQVAGVLELRFARANSFGEADLRSAELMAGLLSEAMATAARMQWKTALVSERQSMLEALERIKPQLQRLGAESSAVDPADFGFAPAVKSKGDAGVRETCAVCGSDFLDQGESFCGICGSARAAAPAPSAPDVTAFGGAGVSGKMGAPTITPYEAESSTNGKSPVAARHTELPASLQELIELSAIQQDAAAHLGRHLERREAPKPAPVAPPAAASPGEPRTEPDFFVRTSDRDLLSKPWNHTSPPIPQSDPYFRPVERPADTARDGESLRIVPADPLAVDLAAANLGLGGLGQVNVGQGNQGDPSVNLPSPWGSAKKAQHWLETVKSRQGPTAQWVAHQWLTRRANIYIGIAALILFIVISGWGMRPNSTAIAGNASPATSDRHQSPAPPKLTPLESILVSLGLAEAPPAPIYLGNPDTQVWVDVHTALYHCPGSDLFGKTSDGRLTTQRDAQQDQFEPANRKACP